MFTVVFPRSLPPPQKKGGEGGGLGSVLRSRVEFNRLRFSSRFCILTSLYYYITHVPVQFYYNKKIQIIRFISTVLRLRYTRYDCDKGGKRQEVMDRGSVADRSGFDQLRVFLAPAPPPTPAPISVEFQPLKIFCYNFFPLLLEKIHLFLSICFLIGI